MHAHLCVPMCVIMCGGVHVTYMYVHICKGRNQKLIAVILLSGSPHHTQRHSLCLHSLELTGAPWLSRLTGQEDPPDPPFLNSPVLGSQVHIA